MACSRHQDRSAVAQQKVLRKKREGWGREALPSFNLYYSFLVVFFLLFAVCLLFFVVVCQPTLFKLVLDLLIPHVTLSEVNYGYVNRPVLPWQFVAKFNCPNYVVISFVSCCVLQGAREDPLNFVTRPLFSSSVASPVWREGPKVSRSNYFEFLTKGSCNSKV